METVVAVFAYMIAVFAVYHFFAKRLSGPEGHEGAELDRAIRFRAATRSLVLCTIVAGAVFALVQIQKASLLPKEVRTEILAPFLGSSEYRHPRIQVIGKGKLYKSDVCYFVVAERYNAQTGTWEKVTGKGIANQLGEDWWEPNIYNGALYDDWDVVCP